MCAQEAEEAEVPLRGGRVTQGVVRVGDTVRRPATDASPFVADLLHLYERRGFAGAPRHLGVDGTGRDVFSYLPGDVPPRFRHWDDAQVAGAGSLLRSLHGASRGSSLAGDRPVVCHHDPGPNNTVFRGGRPVAFIDFDTARPGDPLEDLGYMAWTWCISSRPQAPPTRTQAAQVRVLADAYGLDGSARDRLLDAVLDRQTGNAFWWQGRLGDPAARTPGGAEVRARIDWSRREHAYTAANRAVFASALR
ncbi:phosphotransferase family protein [Streptomyces sp. NPDC048511]|uniref:phosphotransferase family protein n=1 Tax=Streptomyces sp. NPDC048511 TaxID=3365562 RepID=UPI00371ADAE2